MKNAALTTFAATLLAVSGVAQITDWTQVTTASSPSVRYHHAMAYDSMRGKVVMFGGHNGNFLNDTWEYDGVDWTQVTTASSPSARYLHEMSYDSVRGKVVLFGGGDGSYFNDTWEYDGVNWTQVTTASSPSARNAHAMAYDSVRGKVVMFGGYAPASGSLVNDTWEYDGVNWTQVTPASSPSARFRHAMAYDSARGKVVVFGGDVSGVGNANDTWEYDGVNWTQDTPASSPSARDRHTMVYDSLRGKVVMFGGFDDGPYSNDTWEYDGVDWTHVTTANSPSARDGHAMVYDDSVPGKVVMFGGRASGHFNDTWEYGPQGVSYFGTGCPGCIAGTEEGFEGVTPGVGNYPAGWSDGGGTQQWQSRTGTTLSPNTGPNAASEGSDYFYCETSSPAVAGDTYIMTSPVLTGGGAVRFDLSRVGATIGTLDVSVDDGSGPQSIGNYTGEAPSEWSTEILSLPAGLGANYTVTFTYTRGSSWSGDIAIDALCIATTQPLALNSNSPMLGTDWVLTASSVDPISPLCVFWFGDIAINPGFNLDVIGAVGCFAYTNANITACPESVTSGTSTSTVFVPNIPALLAYELTVQASAGSNSTAVGFVTSNGLTGMIGQ